MTFSEKLKSYRAQRGITQTQLADDIHISRSAVAKWENGLGLPNEESIALLAEYFNVPAEEFASVSEESKALPVVTDGDKEKKEKEEKEDKRLTAIGCGVILGIALFVLGFIFVPSLRGSMLGLALGSTLSLIGAFGRFGGKYFLDLFSAKNVSEEDEKPFCATVSNGVLCHGVSVLLTELIDIIAKKNIAFIWIIGLIAEIIMVAFAHVKYCKKDEN